MTVLPAPVATMKIILLMPHAMTPLGSKQVYSVKALAKRQQQHLLSPLGPGKA